METQKQQRNTPSRDIDAEVGRRAHMIMWDTKRKQGEVASAMGIGTDSLGRKLKGERGWALAEVLNLANALDTSVSYLLGETENAPFPEEGGEGWAQRGSNPRPADYQGAVSGELIEVDFARREVVFA